MKLSFYGAAHEVTGSCHFLEAAGKNILIDCGMQQGQDEKNMQEFPIAPNMVDYVLITHAHIDHTGRLPLLSKLGFCGEVYATAATADLCSIMLRDSAHIQEFEAEWRNRKGKRSGAPLKEPLYTMQDAETILKTFVPCAYGETVEICEGLRIRFTDMGHLLGSACIEVFVTESGKETKLVFSGDIGNVNQPLIKDPAYVTKADYVIVESTYGDRLHNAPPDYAAQLADTIQKTFDRGGNVIIPSFAVGRTQELLYFIREIKEKRMVRGHGDFAVYVDSPLAAEATHIFNNTDTDSFDEETTALVRQGINPIGFDGLRISVTSDESKQINFIDTPKVIISASGMCEAGRIKHHLKHNLWRSECTVVFVGYQAAGTTGRALADGAKHVKILGEDIEVKAEIVQLEGISGHADQSGLLRWLAAFQSTPRRIFVVHGEETVCETFGQLVRDRLGYPVSVPFYSECYDLNKNEMLRPGYRQQKAVYSKNETEESGAYQRLRQAERCLEEVIRQNKGGANKDLAKFTDQILALCEKWKRAQN